MLGLASMSLHMICAWDGREEFPKTTWSATRTPANQAADIDFNLLSTHLTVKSKTVNGSSIEHLQY